MYWKCTQWCAIYETQVAVKRINCCYWKKYRLQIQNSDGYHQFDRVHKAVDLRSLSGSKTNSLFQKKVSSWAHLLSQLQSIKLLASVRSSFSKSSLSTNRCRMPIVCSIKAPVCSQMHYELNDWWSRNWHLNFRGGLQIWVISMNDENE